MHRILLAVVIALAACGGSPKAPQPVPPPPPPAPDCQATIGGVLDRMLSQQLAKMTPDERQQSEGAVREMVAHMRTAMVASCTQDQWAPDVRTCMNTAKNDDEMMDRCADKLTPVQKDHVEKAVAEAAKSDEDNGAGDPPPPPEEQDGSAATPAAPQVAAAPLPKECQDYEAAINRLASCDKLPQASRDALKQSYQAVSQAWAKVPADQMAQLAAACKAGADAIVQSGKSVCGW